MEDVIGHHRANTLDDVHNNNDQHEARSTADPRRCDTAREGSVGAPASSRTSLSIVEDIIEHRQANTLDNVLNNDDDPKTKTTSDAEMHAVARDGTLQAAGMPNLPGPASTLVDHPLLVADLPVHAHLPLLHRHPLSTPTERLPEISLMPSRPGFITDTSSMDE
ncbi:hypothetical protein Hypma_011329 [Hypsizygus marmoreus]|uniref:Uncharacterized protein n=1 Tax=Hypsizygus marmoreus TaxID=39966 RepID=A0A369JN59_HYPMA|nr:hypothetical protein Hypma_011329 [Hypsizygus marmoreus]